jgi:cobaltochelatase CobS
MKTLDTLNAHSLRALLREYRNEHYAAAQSAGLGDSATIGSYSTDDLRKWCAQLGIDAGYDAPQTPVAPARNSASAESAGDLMARALALLTPVAPALDEIAVRALVADEMAKLTPRTVRVEIVKDGETVKAEGQHYLFPLIVKLLSAGVNLMLCGPAGTGKTTLVENVAKVLGLPFDFNSFGPGTSKGDLLGYRDAMGEYRDTQLVRMVKAGGIYLADELDRAEGGSLTALHAILANGVISTPGGTFHKQPTGCFVANVNTAGTGANDLYTSAQEQDAALLDRFFFLPMPIDNALEEMACGLSLAPQVAIDVAQGGIVSSEKWLLAVRAAREVCERNGYRHTISPRASIMGAKLCAHGIGVDWLIPGLLTRGLPADESAAIESAARNSLSL